MVPATPLRSASVMDTDSEADRREAKGRPVSLLRHLPTGHRQLSSGDEMESKHHKPNEIIAKLRQFEILMVQGKTVAEGARAIGVTMATYYRWRAKYGGLKLNQVRQLPFDNSAVEPGAENTVFDSTSITSSKRIPAAAFAVLVDRTLRTLRNWDEAGLTHPEMRGNRRYYGADDLAAVLASDRGRKGAREGSIIKYLGVNWDNDT